MIAINFFYKFAKYNNFLSEDASRARM